MLLLRGIHPMILAGIFHVALSVTSDMPIMTIGIAIVIIPGAFD